MQLSFDQHCKLTY